MDEQTSQEIFARLDALADKLGVASGHLWEVLVRQSYAEAAGESVIVIVSLVIIAVAWKLRKILTQRDWGSASDNRDAEVIGTVPAVVITLVSIVVGLCPSLISAVKHVINPEFYAFKEVISVFQ